MTDVYVIAEIGINHNGDMELAKELINGAHASGCNAVKFQKRTIEEVYTPEELDRDRESPWGTTNRQQKEGLEFSIEQYKHLYDYTKSFGLDFIISCWDLNSVDVVEENLNVDFHKVASALTTNREFLERLNATDKPVILSTGMCTAQHIDSAMDILDNVEYVLACTSTYPTHPSEVNLRHMSTLSETFPNVKVGFSNHYNGHDACVGAVALGAQCIEFHITKDRAMYGSDQSASIEKYTNLLSSIRNMQTLLGDGVKVVYESEKAIEKKLRKVDNITE
jgi:N-acetylneuraminate synthase